MKRSRGISKFKRPVSLFIAFCMLVTSIATHLSFVSYGANGEAGTETGSVAIRMEHVMNVLLETDGAGISYDWSRLPEDVADLAADTVLVEYDTYGRSMYFVMATLQDSLWNEEDGSSVLDTVTSISVVFVNQNSKKTVELPEITVIPYDDETFIVSETPDMIWEEEVIDATPSYARRANRIASVSDADGEETVVDSRVLMPRSAKRVLIVQQERADPEKMDFITDIEVFKSDKNGNPVQVPSTGLLADDGILLKYKYEIPGTYGQPSGIVKDIPYQFEMPSGIVLKGVSDFNLLGTLPGHENLVIGKGKVNADGDSATITFTAEAEEKGYLKGGAKGQFYMACGAGEDEIGHGGRIPFEFLIGNELKTIEFNFALNDIKTSVEIEKKGEVKNKDDADPGLGKDNKIVWTIKVTPKMENCFEPGDNELTSLEIVDIFKEEQGLSLDVGTISVIKKDETSNELFDPANLKDVSGKGFTYVLADSDSPLTVEDGDYYSITFETSFELDSWKNSTGDEIEFENSVGGNFKHRKYELNADFEPIISSTEASGEIGKKDAKVKVEGGFISKSGKLQAPANPSTDDWTILWTLTINKNGFALGDVSLTDSMDVEGNPYPDKVFDFSGFNRRDSLNMSDAPVSIPDNGDSVFVNGNGFELELKDVKTPVTVQYTTSVPIEYIKSNAQVKFKNIVDISFGNVRISGIGDDVPVGAKIIKKTSNYDTSNHTVTWTVLINDDGLELTDVVVTDLIPDSLTYVNGTLNAGKADVIEYDENTKRITVKYNSLNTRDEITFDTKINNPHFWATNFNESSPEELKNTVTIEALGMSAGAYSTENIPKVKSEVIAKEVKTGLNLNTREIVWKLNINKNQMLMTHPVITEKIPEGQKFISVTSGAEYIEKMEPTTIDENTREVQIYLKDITDAVPKDRMRTIELKTEVTDLTILAGNGNPLIYNYAEFECDEMENGPPAAAEANTKVPQQFVTKKIDASNAKVKNKLVGWTVVINGNLAKVKDLVLTDHLPDNLTLKMDSVELLKNGTEEMPESFYKISYRKPDFKFIINQEIEESYTLKFDTYFKVDDDSCTNSIDVDAVVGGNSIHADVASQPQKVNWANAGGTGEPPAPGSLTVIKKDEMGNPIKDVQFRLDGFEEIKTTDAQGKAVFDEDMWSGTYTLTEVFAPDMYKTNEPLEISLQVKENKEITVVNKLKKGSLTITKTDGKAPLPGAVFTLYKKEDAAGLNLSVLEPTSGKVTGADGTVTFDNLPMTDYGYVAKETMSPDSYALSEENYSFNIVNDGDAFQWTLVNTKIKSDVLVKKIDSVTGTPVSGAEITIAGTGLDNRDIVMVKVTGADGKARFDDLKFGTYKLTETKAPEGYHLTAMEFAVDVKAHKQEIPVEIKNDPVKGTLNFVKKEINTETLLPGAEIAFFRKNGEEVGRYTTGGDGMAAVNPLSYGDYYYREMKAPDGYVLDEEKHDLKFHITQDGDSMTVVLENRKRTSGGGGGSGTSSKPGKPTADTLPPAPPVNPVGTPTTVVTTPNTDGSTNIKIPDIPSIPPGSDVAVTNLDGNIVYRGKPDEKGYINTNLVPGDYSLFVLDDQGVPLAQMPFTIFDGEVPLGALPKTGESGLPCALLFMILLGIFGTCTTLVIVDSKKPVIWYKKKNRLLDS